MVELMDVSKVFWYAHQRAYCSAFRNWASYINAAVDIYFTKETLASCCAMESENKSKSGHPPLNPVIIQALIAKCSHKFLLFLTRGYAKRRNRFLLRLRCANVSLAHSAVESS